MKYSYLNPSRPERLSWILTSNSKELAGSSGKTNQNYEPDFLELTGSSGESTISHKGSRRDRDVYCKSIVRHHFDSNRKYKAP